MFEWAYSGTDGSVPRNFGPECAYYLSIQRIIIETVIICILCISAVRYSLPKLVVPDADHGRSDRGGRRLLLIAMTLFWGMEIGFKFASKTVIYLLNPCHVTTAIQIYLLAAPPSKTTTAVFRFHLNFLNGPLLACLFPETASRKIPLEMALYWIQHGMMFVIPYYLLRIGGVYNVEPLGDFKWCIFAYAINILYHYTVLQSIGMSVQVNLNHMLCPAILDPFEGQWYRVAATIHQALLCPLLCKVFCVLADFILTKFPPTKIKPSLGDDITSKNAKKHIE